MKLLIALWLLILTAIAAFAFSSVRFELPLKIIPGQEFILSAYITSDDSLLGITYFLLAPTEAHLWLLGRDTASSPFTDEITSDVRGPLGPTFSFDLGALVDDLTIPATPGEHLLATYTLLAQENAVHGAWKLTMGTTSVAVHEDFSAEPIFASANVQIAPEPASSILLMFGCLPFLCRRKS